jgi:excisionase family DNA binding protein
MINVGEQTGMEDGRKSVATVVEEAAWISYSEAQKYAGLSRTKLWQLISSGDVEAAKIGRAVRISRRSLEDYMKRNSYVQAAG